MWQAKRVCPASLKPLIVVWLDRLEWLEVLGLKLEASSVLETLDTYMSARCATGIDSRTSSNLRRASRSVFSAPCLSCSEACRWRQSNMVFTSKELDQRCRVEDAEECIQLDMSGDVHSAWENAFSVMQASCFRQQTLPP